MNIVSMHLIFMVIRLCPAVMAEDAGHAIADGGALSIPYQPASPSFRVIGDFGSLATVDPDTGESYTYYNYVWIWTVPEAALDDFDLLLEILTAAKGLDVQGLAGIAHSLSRIPKRDDGEMIQITARGNLTFLQGKSIGAPPRELRATQLLLSRVKADERGAPVFQPMENANRHNFTHEGAAISFIPGGTVPGGRTRQDPTIHYYKSVDDFPSFRLPGYRTPFPVAPILEMRQSMNDGGTAYISHYFLSGIGVVAIGRVDEVEDESGCDLLSLYCGLSGDNQEGVELYVAPEMLFLLGNKDK